VDGSNGHQGLVQARVTRLTSIGTAGHASAAPLAVAQAFLRALSLALGKRGWSAEAFCEDIVGGPLAGVVSAATRHFSRQSGEELRLAQRRGAAKLALGAASPPPVATHRPPSLHAAVPSPTTAGLLLPAPETYAQKQISPQGDGEVIHAAWRHPE
jgi:hypothetical protein